MGIICHIDLHEGLADVNLLTRIHKTLCHLARNAKTQIALNPRSNDARE